MATDPAGKAWQSIARDLVERLPGRWRTAGTGIRTVLVREPIEWVVVWVGTSRMRKSDPPYLMGGEAELVGPPFTLAKGHGIRSDERRGKPSQIDPTAPDAAAAIEAFVVEDVLPRVDPWTPERLAAVAEEQLVVPMRERGRPIIFQNAAGWRVILSDESPEDPAEQAAGWFGESGSPEEAEWYRQLAAAWRSGGRAEALRYLEGERTKALASLKLA